MKKLVTHPILTFIGFALLLIACEKEGDFPLEAIEIRVENTGNFDFDLVNINTGGGQQTYTTVEAGQKTSYKTFSYGYNYAAIRIEANGEIFGIQPIDYVGEKPLKKGKYTYQLALTGTTKGSYFTSKLQKD